jgi:hypothetical protein
LFYENIRKPKADFYKLDRGQFVCSHRAKGALEKLKDLGGQLFPVFIEGEPEPHYLFVVTRIGSFFDPKNSVWEHTDEIDPDTEVPFEPFIEFEAFYPAKVPRTGVFRELKDGAKRVFCTESSASAKAGEFKATVEQHGLLGLDFVLAWSQKSGPALPSWGPSLPGAVWKTGDGRIIRENKESIPKQKATDSPSASRAKPKDEKEPRLRVYQLGFPAALRLISESTGKNGAEELLRFDGRPMEKRWKPPVLAFANGKPQKSDFFPVGEGAFVCSNRAQMECAPLEDEGQFIPVKIRGLRGKFFLYNSTNCLNCLDPKKTKWKKRGQRGVRESIVRPVFRPERFGEVCLFKLTEDGGATLYCLERSGDFGDGELKALVKQHRLKGLKFTRVFEVRKKLGKK